MDKDFSDKVISLYTEQRLSGAKIAKLLDVNQYYVYKIIKEKGVGRNDSEKSLKYFCDFNYFDHIDSEEKAYWLGFIAADGYIRSKSKYNNMALGICLSQKDRSHLEKFKNAINATNPILDFKEKNFGTIESRIIITNEHLCNRLIELGVVEHKSLTLKFPTEYIPHKYINHYVRGYFDGDGSIKLSNGRYTASILGTKEFLSEIKKIYAINSKISKNKNTTKNSCNIEVGGNLNALKFLSNLYENSSIYLDRKYERYNNLKHKYNNSSLL